MKKLIIFSIVLMLNACAQFGRTPEPQLIQIKEVSEKSSSWYSFRSLGRAYV